MNGVNTWDNMTIDCPFEGMGPVPQEKVPGKQLEVFHIINEEIIQPHTKIKQLLIQNGTRFMVDNDLR